MATDSMETTGEVQSGRSTLDRTKTVQDFAEEYLQIADAELPVSLGFSARLNMLWDLAGAAPPQIEGRVLSILGINSAWRETDVRKWLQKDVLPPRIDLHNMVRFLVTQLNDSQNSQRWEAFLIYGSPIVSSPINHIMYRQDQTRREIASAIFASTKRNCLSGSAMIRSLWKWFWTPFFRKCLN